MLINDKVDAVYIPDSPSRIKATDYNQIKNEIQGCITEAGLTPTKDVIQLPQALKILTAQSGAEEVAKIEAAGAEQLQAVNTAGATQTNAVNTAGETQTAAVNAAGQTQLNAINTAGAQAVQDAQTAAGTATTKAQEAIEAAASAASYSSTASSAADNASLSAENAAQSASSAASAASQSAQSAASIEGDAEAAAASASAAAQSAQDAADSAASIIPGNYVKKSGDTMTGPLNVQKAESGSFFEARDTSVDYTQNPSKDIFTGYYSVKGKDGKTYSRFYSRKSTNGNTGSAIQAFTSDGQNVAIEVFINEQTKNKFATCPTPASTASGVEIVTASWVRNLISGTTIFGDYINQRYTDANGNWYEIYKSGWIRQGGYTTANTITLLKPMSNNKYSVFTSTTVPGNGGIRIAVNNKTTSSFSVVVGFGDHGGGGNFTGDWCVEGQGA